MYYFLLQLSNLFTFNYTKYIELINFLRMKNMSGEMHLIASSILCLNYSKTFGGGSTYTRNLLEHQKEKNLMALTTLKS